MLHINDLVYRVGGRTIFDRATAHVPAGQKLGLVGRNGAGKTTLLRLVAGELAPDGGELRLRRGARIGVVAQEAPGGDDSLVDIVLAADVERAQLLAEAETATDPHRIAEIHERLVAIDAHGAPARAAAILDGLGFDEAARRRPAREYSGGWRMRVALGALLFVEPDLLLLDEPTNYLDLEGALWLENFLRTYPRTLLLVSHDRYFLNRVVDGILHVDNGKLASYRGGYDAFERVRREKLVLQEKMRVKQEAQAKHMQAFVDRFRYKASKARQAQSRLKALARMQPIAAVMEEATIELRFPEPAPLPDPLVVLEKGSVGYEPGRPVLRRLDLRIDADDRIALLGRNGNGKSTFAKLLAGRLALDAGTMQASPKLRVGYFGQHQIEELNPALSAFAHLAALLPGAPEAKVRARLGAFGFSQGKADVAAAELSGGEKARLVFALITAGDPQLLLLDEPTNHLDIDSREVLVQALNDYAGAVILVSHDRHLVELAADRLWLVAGGTITPFDGDLDDYRAQVLAAPRESDGAGARNEQRPSRKDDRRAGAEARAKLAPLRRAAEAAEARVGKLTAALKRLEDRLADPGIYDGPADRVTALTRERADAARALAEAEAAWLEAAEAYETAAAAEAALSP